VVAVLAWTILAPGKRSMILPTDFLRYSAIAEEDEKYRFKSEAQFPEHKSLPFLMERKAVMTRARWESEYQQNPMVAK
jgi:hypothetical protein